MKAVIMAGGIGSRLQPFTYVLPKPLIPLSDIPILEITIRQLAFYGFRSVTLALGYAAELIKAYFSDGSKWGIDIHYVVESKPMGTAGALSLLGEFSNPVLLMNADILTDIDFRLLYNFHLESNALATVALYEHKQLSKYGVITVSETGQLISYQEKPIRTELVSTGVYIISPTALLYMTTSTQDMPQLVASMIDNNEVVCTQLHQGIWKDIGNPEQLQEARQLFAGRPSYFLKGRTTV